MNVSVNVYTFIYIRTSITQILCMYVHVRIYAHTYMRILCYIRCRPADIEAGTKPEAIWHLSKQMQNKK